MLRIFATPVSHTYNYCLSPLLVLSRSCLFPPFQFSIALHACVPGYPITSFPQLIFSLFVHTLPVPQPQLITKKFSLSPLSLLTLAHTLSVSHTRELITGFTPSHQPFSDIFLGAVLSFFSLFFFFFCLWWVPVAQVNQHTTSDPQEPNKPYI